jgi:predicted nucleic acid-binding protein
MRVVFADTGYWIALVNPHDALHQKSMSVSRRLAPCQFVTSDMVLVEVLNMFAGRGPHLRGAAVAAVRMITTSDLTVEVVPQTRELFRAAYDLYSVRNDKSWSLTDCASFVIMGQRGIIDALTHDTHFEQNGYTALLR